MRISDWSSDVCSSDLTPVNFIVHSVDEVNAGLSQGRYFFMDVARDGIAIYQAVDDDLPEQQPKTPHAALEMAREYFDGWYPSVGEFFETASLSRQSGWTKNGAVLLLTAVASSYTKKGERGVGVEWVRASRN